METRFNLKPQPKDQDCRMESWLPDCSSEDGQHWLEDTKFQLGETYDKHAR